MNWFNLVGIALGLAMDAFAVSIAAGIILPKITFRHTYRLAFHFGLFQFLMPILGWLAGNELSAYLAQWDHWIAFVFLSLIGGKMIHDGVKPEQDGFQSDPTRGMMLVTLSIATSIDALAVGVSMAFMGVSVWVPAVVIGLVAAGMSVIGLSLGRRLGKTVDQWAYVLGGCVLILIGLRILSSHLSGA